MRYELRKLSTPQIYSLSRSECKIGIGSQLPPQTRGLAMNATNRSTARPFRGHFVLAALASEEHGNVYMAVDATLCTADRVFNLVNDAFGLALTRRIRETIDSRSDKTRILSKLFIETAHRAGLYTSKEPELAREVAEDCHVLCAHYHGIDPNAWSCFQVHRIHRGNIRTSVAQAA